MKKQFVKPECKFMNLKFESLLHETSVPYGGVGDGTNVDAKYNNFFGEDEDDLDF